MGMGGHVTCLVLCQRREPGLRQGPISATPSHPAHSRPHSAADSPVRGTCRKKTSLLTSCSSSRSAVCASMYLCTRAGHSLACRSRRSAAELPGRRWHVPSREGAARRAAAAATAASSRSAVAAGRMTFRCNTMLPTRDTPAEAPSGGQAVRCAVLLPPPPCPPHGNRLTIMSVENGEFRQVFKDREVRPCARAEGSSSAWVLDHHTLISAI